MRTTFGSRVLAEFVPDVDDAVVTALAAAGTISLGKTNTPEFGFPCYTDNDVAGPARCPWDPSLLAGGSSGGAAVGGRRRPAALRAGLRRRRLDPHPGRHQRAVRHQAQPRPGQQRAVQLRGDRRWACRARWPAPSGTPPRCWTRWPGRSLGDPFWAAPLPAGETFLGYADRAPGRLRIGRYQDSGMPGVELDPEVRAAFEDASPLLSSLGHDVEDVPRRAARARTCFPSFEVVWALSATTLPVPDAAVPHLRPLTRLLRERGLALSAQDAMEAMFALRLFARRFIAGDQRLRRPARADLHDAAPAGRLVRRRDGAEDFERQKRYAAFTALSTT